jgi:hypothetical protein
MPPIIPGQGQAGMMPGQGQPGMQPPQNPLAQAMQMIQQINSKLDAVLQKLGGDNPQPDKEQYMKLSPEEQDAMDEKQVLGKT